MKHTHYNVPSMKFSNSPGCPTIDLQVGDVVIDLLMSSHRLGIVGTAEILEIWKDDNKGFPVYGLKLNATHLEGLRHPWEICLVEQSEKDES